MTDRQKNYAIILLAMAGIALCVAAVMVSDVSVAHAAATPKYIVTFDYTHYTQQGSVLKEGKNVTVTPSLASGGNAESTIRFTLYGSTSLGSGTLNNSGAINSSTVNISAETGFAQCAFTIQNSRGAAIATSSSKTLKAEPLADGIYTVTAKLTGNGYYAVCSFRFQVDTAVPVLQGASPSATGKYVNTEFTVRAADEDSGIKNLYVKRPNSDNFVAEDAELTIGNDSPNGLYSFYATDNARNKSATQYVYFDDTKPVGMITNADGEIIAGEFTSESFCYSAADRESGIASLQYKTPGSDSWKTYYSGLSIPASSAYGTYTFRAADKAQNYSDELSITLQPKDYPKAEIIRSDTDNSVRITWDTSDCTGTLNGKNYIKDTWIKEEGTYTFILTGSNGMSSTYTFEIEHYYVLEKTEPPSCVNGGYSLYRCVHCGHSYQENHTGLGGHRYAKTVVDATCTTSGYTQYACGVCGDVYKIDETPPKGHSLTEETKEATCTERGGTQHICEVCGYSYITDIVEPRGHSYISEIIHPSGCTEAGARRYRCEYCSDGYEKEIPALGHQYAISDVEAEDGHTIRTYTCTVCGDSYTQNLGNQYEEVSSYIEYLFDLYAPYMIWVFLATAGVWSIAIGVVIIIAYKNEEKEKAKKMLVNYVIGMIVIFCILIACPYLVRGIAALIT